MFPIVKDGGSSPTAILLAGYRMILTSKTIGALSHAAVGHNFKSDIYFYELPGTYIDKILEPIVNSWLQVTTILCWKKMEI